MAAVAAAAAPAAPPPCGWVSLGTPQAELCLANTLVTGQSFRWRRTSAAPLEVFTGVVGPRLVQMRQLDDDVQYRVLARSPTLLDASAAGDAAALQDYLNLSTSLTALSAQWAARDARYALIAPALPGCRMLRQDPVECLFQFICSSNNHISRIHGMVERLCSTYGSPLAAAAAAAPALPAHQQQHHHHQQHAAPSDSEDDASGSDDEGRGDASVPFALPPSMQQQAAQQQASGQVEVASDEAMLGLGEFYAFPTLQQLAAATEEGLRADGFGYRAKFIVGSVAELLAKPEGGDAWLAGLRAKPYQEAHEALCTLPGVGPKVAACICLFALDKHDAIPVDTHVWDLATRHYAPHLAKQALTPKLHGEVQRVFVERFGAHAGWAHNCLFISELASHRHLLPPGLERAAKAARAGGAGEAAAGTSNSKKRKQAAAGGGGGGAAAAAEPATPLMPGSRRRQRAPRQ